MKQYVALSQIDRVVTAGKMATPTSPAVAPSIKSITPGTIFVPKDADEEKFLLEAGHIRAYDPNEMMSVPASRALETQTEQPESEKPAKKSRKKAAEAPETDEND